MAVSQAQQVTYADPPGAPPAVLLPQQSTGKLAALCAQGLAAGMGTKRHVCTAQADMFFWADM